MVRLASPETTKAGGGYEGPAPYDLSVYFYTNISEADGNNPKKWTDLTSMKADTSYFSSVGETTLDGQSAFDAIEGGMSAYYSVVVGKNSHIYKIMFDRREAKSELSETERMVLSSFRFTDPTVGWKTYINSTYGYTVKYPIDWETKTLTSTGVVDMIGLRPNTMKEDVAMGISIEEKSLSNAIATKKAQYASNSTFEGQSTVKINNVDFTALRFKNISDSTIQPTTYLVAKGKYVYAFTTGTMSENDATGSAINATEYQIASTFQFTK